MLKMKGNVLPLALLLAAIAVWSVRPAVGDDGDTPAPTVEQQLADHEERIAQLERQLGDPARAGGSIDARLRAVELEVEQLERDLEEAGEGGGDDDGTMLRALQRRLESLATRIERIDRNRLVTAERDITNLQREVRDLDQRLRRIE
jgi:chromosome segregation ATPase